ncbi:F-box only protein 10 isoform X1 [Polyodon spathula]|uniref:F-box only protein 10 isoform X1 n=1 Tax=Polyodon spathula TaxID=7913 RepID=UPI001B7DD379|nr:F-box only protein 10 isoform X1 [Polyodon spathula]XP_041082169.1 F-box only protein 10 isoform X1 [Polyodon spathula]
MEISSLPLELWRLILAYLPLSDLGRCSLVCRAWCELILSLDKTRWRQLCLDSMECKHPNWPNQPPVEPPSWREAFKQHYLASNMWNKNGQELESSNCLYLFRRKKDRKIIHVGTGCDHDNLRSALAVANVYDKIVLHPGVYEEQSEVVLKMPVEIMGEGKLGDVTLLVGFDQRCPTARLCNLVFMPAWFSPVLYKTSSGHVQFDNCNLENGQVHIYGPGTCQIKFCTFSQCSINFHWVVVSLLENCEFIGSENNSVTVEGYPASDRNWACKHLAALAKSKSFLNAVPSDSKQPSDGLRTLEIVVNQNHPSELNPEVGSKDQKLDSGMSELYITKGQLVEHGEVLILETDNSDSDLSTASENEDDEQLAYKLSYQSHGLSHLLERTERFRPQGDRTTPLQTTLALRTFQQELQRDKEVQALASSLQGCHIRKCLFRDGKGGVLVCVQAQARLEGNMFRDLTYAVRCIQNAKIIMLKNEICHCKASGVFMRLSAYGLIADNNIHSNAEAGVDIRKGANPLILCNRIHSGLRSGIVILGNGKGIIRSNQIYGNKEAGIYILYNGNPVVSGNHIYQGLAAGIAVNENGRGQIVENIIRENQWGGADIRRGGDPILKNNLICHGHSDGVVVGERGKGLIEGNTIYCNKGCGVWIMSSSLPHITSNQISHNSIYGVAVFCRKDDANDYQPSQGGNFNEDGELINWENDLDSEEERFSSRQPISVALIKSNSISHNRAVGIYIKSSEALNIMGNAIHANHENGITVFQSSQLTRIANNSVTRNTICGILVEAGCRVELRGNGVYDNNSHGITSKGDGVILENDIIGNHGCALKLLETADMKVMKNRIQSHHDYGIAVLDQVKGLVQDNLIFQGKSSKAVIQKMPMAEECIVQNNELLAFNSKNSCKSQVTWKLENPPARPHIEGQPRGPFTMQTSQGMASMTTRIAARVEGGCHNGSIFCSIL